MTTSFWPVAVTGKGPVPGPATFSPCCFDVLEGAGSYPPNNDPLLEGRGAIDAFILGAIFPPQALGHDRIEQKGGWYERNG